MRSHYRFQTMLHPFHEGANKAQNPTNQIARNYEADRENRGPPDWKCTFCLCLFDMKCKSIDPVDNLLWNLGGSTRYFTQFHHFSPEFHQEACCWIAALLSPEIGRNYLFLRVIFSGRMEFIVIAPEHPESIGESPLHFMAPVKRTQSAASLLVSYCGGDLN